jgi:hypothetical protein
MTSPEAALYQQLDPTHPLEADETALYVNWQADLGEDVKRRLVRSIALSGTVPTVRLFTGHRGVGKSTELKRVQRMLEEGKEGRQIFVSYLEGERWLDLQDPTPAEIVFQIVRQLANDLRTAGFAAGEGRVQGFLREIREILAAEVEPKGISLPTGFGDLEFDLKKAPSVRNQLRDLLEKRLPTLYDLINGILREAKAWLKETENGAYDDVLVIVDELDRIPQKVVKEGLTNHESLFLDQAATLRALDCHVLYTIPIELAYSPSRNRLNQTYGTEFLTLPVLPVTDRQGAEIPSGRSALERIVALRARRAGVAPEAIFAAPDLCSRVCGVSGGHVRTLFLLIRSALDRTEKLPISAEAVERTIRRQASDLALPLSRVQWEALKTVHRTREALNEEAQAHVWNGLLKDLYVFSYEDDRGAYYDWNPLAGVAAELRREGVP